MNIVQENNLSYENLHFSREQLTYNIFNIRYRLFTSTRS